MSKHNSDVEFLLFILLIIGVKCCNKLDDIKVEQIKSNKTIELKQGGTSE